MNENVVIFSIDNQTNITIKFEASLLSIDIEDQSDFYFKRYNHKIFLTYDFLYQNIHQFNNLLNLALNNNLQLPPLENKDVGYLWNECCNQYKYNELITSHNKYEILYNYLIFNSVFLYNDHENNIILNISRLYPLTNARKKRKRSYNNFMQWLESYKPIFKTIISPEIAHQWIAQAQDMIEIIEKNTDILRAQE
jgi:hypothetical protein